MGISLLLSQFAQITKKFKTKQGKKLVLGNTGRTGVDKKMIDVVYVYILLISQKKVAADFGRKTRFHKRRVIAGLKRDFLHHVAVVSPARRFLKLPSS